MACSSRSSWLCERKSEGGGWGGRVGALCCDVIRLSGTLTSRHRARYKADGDIMWRLYRATLRASSSARPLHSPSTAKTTYSLFALPTSIHIAFLRVSLSIIIHQFSCFLYISIYLQASDKLNTDSKYILAILLMGIRKCIFLFEF